MSAIKQIVIFQLKALRMAGFLEFVQQVLNIVRTYRDSGEAGDECQHDDGYTFLHRFI